MEFRISKFDGEHNDPLEWLETFSRIMIINSVDEDKVKKSLFAIHLEKSAYR